MNELVQYIKKRIEYHEQQLNHWRNDILEFSEDTITHYIEVYENKKAECQHLLDYYYASHPDNSRQADPLLLGDSTSEKE